MANLYLLKGTHKNDVYDVLVDLNFIIGIQVEKTSDLFKIILICMNKANFEAFYKSEEDYKLAFSEILFKMGSEENFANDFRVHNIENCEERKSKISELLKALSEG